MLMLDVKVAQAMWPVQVPLEALEMLVTLDAKTVLAVWVATLVLTLATSLMFLHLPMAMTLLYLKRRGDHPSESRPVLAHQLAFEHMVQLETDLAWAEILASSRLVELVTNHVPRATTKKALQLCVRRKEKYV